MSGFEIVTGFAAVVGLIAAFGLGVIAGCVRWDKQRKQLKDTIADLVDARDELLEERALVDGLVEDLIDTRKALRAAIADPSKASPRHMTITRIREIADRPLPGESTGAHAATEETDRA